MIPYIETHIVDHCNLKCRGCSHFSCIADTWYKDITEFNNEFTQLSKIIDNIEVIRIMGGEPLIHPNFIDFCIIARNNFPNSKIVLVTNGILLSKLEPYIEILNQLNITLCMSDYHIDATNKFIFDALNNIEVHEKGAMYNISLDLSGHQDINKSFDACDLHNGQFYYYQNGRFYPCCIMGNIFTFEKHFNKNLDLNLDEISIDIYNHTEEEILNFLNNPIRGCQYCNILKRLSKIKPWAQTKGDIKEWICQ